MKSKNLIILMKAIIIIMMIIISASLFTVISGIIGRMLIVLFEYLVIDGIIHDQPL